MLYTAEREIGEKKLIIETGKLAPQADAAVTVRCGDSIILATACVAPRPRADIDFLPLTVDYEERHYAAGRIPGSFFRREGRPGQDAILFGRLTDRSLRPLFPKGFYNDVQIILTVLSVDKENPPEILGIVGGSAALAISDIPFQGPIGASRIAHSNGVYTANPTYDEIHRSDLSVVVATTSDAIMMVEAAGTEAEERVVVEAIRRAQEANSVVLNMIEELVSAAGKPKMSYSLEDTSAQNLEGEINTILNGRMLQVLETRQDKADREHSLHVLEEEVRERLEQHPKEKVAAAFESTLKGLIRSRILHSGVRPDGRGLKDIRPITCEVGVLPRTHGTGLFARGETQVLSIATLASKGMEQTLDTLSPDDKKRYMHHYNFTPYSTNEVKRVGSTGRREIGHGALAERAVEPMLPDEEEFPYTLRIVSEVMSSNGSTSMASVCGSTLALMDAGVPLTRPVGGVAMGLIMGENGAHAVLTDIEGMEDHLGDMDFKVAGTVRGINALQLDVKVRALTTEVLERALEQAREGRLFILEKMQAAIAEPRSQLSPYAPKLIRMIIPVDKIGALIGPGGRNIRAIQEDLSVSIDTQDNGTVIIGGTDDAALQKAKARVESFTRELAVGDIFTGKVVRVTSFGGFVQLLPGKDGLLRTEELGDVESPLEVGQELTVVIQEIDHLGRINLSRRALYGDQAGQGETPSRPPGPIQGQPRPGGAPLGPRGSGGDRRPPPGRAPGQDRRPPPRSGFRGPGR